MADERKPDMTIEELKTHVDERFAGVDVRFKELDKRLGAEHIQTRRHFELVAERLEGYFRLLAERGDVDHQRLEDH